MHLLRITNICGIVLILHSECSKMYHSSTWRRDVHMVLLDWHYLHMDYRNLFSESPTLNIFERIIMSHS